MMTASSTPPYFKIPLYFQSLLVMALAVACAEGSGFGPAAQVGADAAASPQGPHDECGNGMDDDGDGTIDEGCFCGAGESQSCFRGDYPERAVGACSDGVQLCDTEGSVEFGQWGRCEGDTLPATEICDGAVDEDCDGAVDEGCPCTIGEVRACGLEFLTAPCTGGEQLCRTDGTWSGCEGAIGPSADICEDDIDNDCDGESNEGCGCVPEPEICGDGIDNDCDGEVDEDSCRVGTMDAEPGAADAGTVNPSCPVPVTGIVDIAGDYWRQCALHRDGRVFCWGSNAFGALGQGDEILEQSSTPLLVTGGVTVTPGVATFAVGASLRACVLKPSGVVCWGRKAGGAFFGGEYINVAWRPYSPPEAGPVTGVVQLAVGLDHTIMRKADGTLWGWGYDGAGSLGDGPDRVGGPAAYQALTIDDAVVVESSDRSVCAIRSDRSVWCWGESDEGQAGVVTTFGEDREEPFHIVGIDDAVQLAVGNMHVCALRATGQVACWGVDGARGDGMPYRSDTDNTSTPVPVPGLTDVEFLEAGKGTTCAIRTGGELWCWGGWIGSAVGETSPVKMEGLEPVVDVSVGSIVGDPVGDWTVWGSMCALDHCGRVLCWGDNQFGQNGDGTTNPSATPVEVIGLP